MTIRRRFVLFSAANVWRTLVGIGLLPLTTMKLEAADFGLFAIVVALSGASLGLSGLGIGQILSAHLSGVDAAEKRRLVTTVLAMSFAVAMTTAALIHWAWPLITPLSDELAEAEASARFIAVALILLWTPWSVASAVATIEGRALGFASVVIGESTVNAITVLLCLFWLELGGISLLIGAFTGACANAVGSLFVLREKIGRVWSARWMRDCLKVGALSMWSGAAERGLTLAERLLLAGSVSAAAVGFLSHAQQYQGLARMGMKSWANAFWPETLAEGKDVESTFRTTRSLFARAQVLLSLGAIAMACIGRDAIALLTNEKLTGAYLPAVVLLMLVQIEYMARPQLALLYANGRYGALQAALIGSQIVAFGAMVPAIAAFGIYGALAAQATQTVIYRSLVVRAARKVRRVPTLEGTALWGIAGTIVALGGSLALPDSLAARVVIGGVVATAVVLRYVTATRRQKRP